VRSTFVKSSLKKCFSAVCLQKKVNKQTVIEEGGGVAEEKEKYYSFFYVVVGGIF